MGNASSASTNGRPSNISPRPRQASISPSPGNPHHSLKTKKKSLELPDLALLTLSSTRGRPVAIPPKSASIPIPVGPQQHTAIPGEAGRTRAPIELPSTTDVRLFDAEAYRDGRAYPPPSRSDREQREQREGGRDRDRDRDRDRAERDRDRAHRSRNRRMQEMYEESQAPVHPPMLVDPFIPETVLSTIPLALTKALHREHEGPPELVQVKITWRGGGKSIFLARAGDDDWKGRQQMTQESPGSTTYHASVSLPPGTHHIRFLIDDTWRVADDLPTAVDDQGSLANYVAVPINYSPPPVSNVPASPPTARPRPQGQSFWSAASSTSDDDPPPTHSQPSTAATTTGKPPPQAVWTSVLPQELIEAAHEEEMYLAASEGQPHSHHSGAQIHRVAGFVPAPNIPPAPGLPRHLDKLILNARVVVGGAGGAVVGTGVRKVGTGGTGTGPTEGGANGGVSNSVAGRSKGRERERDRERRDGENRDRDRDRREGREGWRDERASRREREGRERERDRDRERRNPPPPPPPSEAGTVDAEPEVIVSPALPSPTSPTPTSPYLTSPLATSPIPGQDPPLLSSPMMSSAFPSSPLVPSSTPTRPLTLNIDSEAGTPALTDDASVLPVPSHVVLHHLSTSAIRNGVLAVGNTTRYRKKYLTTIYYKPT